MSQSFHRNCKTFIISLDPCGIMQLKNKTILITGGTSGIGRALVQLLAPVNKAIIVIAKNPQRLDVLRGEYNNVHTYVCCLESQESVLKTLDVVLNHHPDLAVVINNAGIQHTAMLHDPDFDFDGITTEIAVNLAAPVWICALTVRHLLQSGAEAAYVNITSGLAHYPKRSSAVYCATKAGLFNFTTSLRYQLEKTNIGVYSAILPLVDTPMTLGRGRRKLSANMAARQIVKGVEHNRQDIYVGKTKWIPLLSRLSPRLMRSILKNA